MNYFLLLVIVGVCGGSYYMYTNDQEQIASLQQEIAGLKGHGSVQAVAPAATLATVTPLATVAPLSTTPAPASAPATVAPVTTTAPLPVTTVAPVVGGPGHSDAIDSAANAAVAAANGSSIGTITTLDHKTYTNCKVLKVEKDGVTFNHDEGITKILYPMMPPDLQKQFGYTPEAAVAETEAEIRARQQAAATTNPAPATP